MKQTKQKEIEEFLYSKGKWKLLSEYKGFHDSIIIEKDGYIVETSFASFSINNKPIIFGTKNIYYKQNIKLFLERNHPEVVFIDAQKATKNGKTRIIIEMKDENGHIFKNTWEHIFSNNKKICCKLCARRKQTDNHREKMFNKWYSLIDQNYFEILELPEYLTSDSFVIVEEKKTGYRYNASIRAFEKEFRSEPFNAHRNKDFYLYNLNIYKQANGLNSTPLSIKDTSSSHNIVTFQCCCGELFDRSVHKWMNGKDLCKECSQLNSSNERCVKDFLNEIGIEYIEEFRFNSCKDLKPLPFDFYLKKYNCLIEIDGEQHYNPIAFDGNFETANKKFILQQKHDNIKNEFCKNNNIPLLRIPYYRFLTNEWKTDIINFIKPLESSEL